MGPGDDALPTFGGNNGFATSVNDLGQVVGWAENSAFTTQPAFLLRSFNLRRSSGDRDPNQIQQLPPYAGDPDGAATGINDKGQVIGISGICQNAVGNQSAIHAAALAEWHGDQSRQSRRVSRGTLPWPSITMVKSLAFPTCPVTEHGANPNFHAFLWTHQSHGIQDLRHASGRCHQRSLGY